MPEKIVLTDRALKALKPAPPGKRIVTWDAVQPHLGIRVTDTGAKSFVVVKRLTGAPAPIVQVLGSYPAIALAEARKKARVVLGQIAEGIDPKKEEKAKRAESQRLERNTLKEIAKTFVAKHARRNRTGKETERIIDLYLTPVLGHRPIKDIKRREIAELLDAIEERRFVSSGGRLRGGPVMADRVLAVLRKLMNWHATRDDEFVSPIVKGMARSKPNERKRSRILSDDEIRAMWWSLDENTLERDARAATNIFAGLVRILLLTAQRREEVAGMARSEIGPDAVWTIPAPRHKTGDSVGEKLVPLSTAARRIIDGIERVEECDLVFTTTGTTSYSGFSKAKRQLDQAMLAALRKLAMERNDSASLAKLDEIVMLIAAAKKGETAAREKLKRAWWTLHDLRRTAKTLMIRSGVRPDISERVLGHAIAGVEGVYDRYEYLTEKRAALEQLSTLVHEIIGQPQDVVGAFDPRS